MNDSLSVLMCSNKIDEGFRLSVASILDQTYSSFEFVIVANCISDEEFKCMASYCTDKRIRLHRSSLKGLAVNLNIGLNYCTSELVCRMDADDVSYLNRLETLKCFMDAHPDVDVCGSGFDVINESGEVLHYVKPLESNREIRRALYYKNPLCHPSVIFRRNIVDMIGGYSSYRFAQDYDLWLRLSDDKSIVFANLPDSLLGYRSIGAEARGAVTAYLYVADAYLNKLVRTGNPTYILSLGFFVLKAVVKRIMGRI